uniref:Uncharacterized protein n=1 Tax=Arundo donax TaxID=35708 RepID=A0A0A9AZE4_ARUDO
MFASSQSLLRERGRKSEGVTAKFGLAAWAGRRM